MKRMHSAIALCFLSLAIALAVALAQPAFAQELGGNKPPKAPDRSQDAGGEQDKSSDSLTRAELKKRFESRFERINALKDDGRIGETFDGWVEPLHEGLLNSDQRDLLAVENADRKALYALIADRVDEAEKRVPPRVVAERNARRNFEKAEPDQLLKVSEGYWIAKRDLSRVEDITRAKKSGDIGETWEGSLGIVNTHPSDDVKSLVENENASRREIYSGVAKKLDKGSPAEVGRSIGKSTRDNLQVGQYYQSKNGNWEKRQTR